MLQRIADRAMQVFGAMGGSDDTPIHQALAWGRLLRIGDGPDEVHLRQIFRMEAMPSWSIADFALSRGASVVIFSTISRSVSGEVGAQRRVRGSLRDLDSL